jgi:DNA-binding NarL/FixJ family response regulator
MSAADTFLVVEDNDGVSSWLAYILQPHGETLVAAGIRDAERLLAADRRWAGFVIDPGLPDGCGLELLRRLRTLHPKVPALVYTGHLATEVALATFDLEVDLLPKDVRAEARIERWAHKAKSFEARLVSVVDSWPVRSALTATERDTVLRYARGEKPPEIAAARDSSEKTVKKHVQNLLPKMGASSIRDLVERLLREVAGG